MKRITLTPAQVFATNEFDAEAELALKIYYRVFQRGSGECLPPILVGTIKSPSEWVRRLEQGYERWERDEQETVQMRRREYWILFQKLREIPYYILDGNHRALAAALNRRNLNALQVDSDEDLSSINWMLAEGELFSFPHKAKSIETLEGLFVQHFLNLNNIPPNHALVTSQKLSVEELVPVATLADELCRQKKLPSYMARNYARLRRVPETV